MMSRLALFMEHGKNPLIKLGRGRSNKQIEEQGASDAKPIGRVGRAFRRLYLRYGTRHSVWFVDRHGSYRGGPAHGSQRVGGTN